MSHNRQMDSFRRNIHILIYSYITRMVLSSLIMISIYCGCNCIHPRKRFTCFAWHNFKKPINSHWICLLLMAFTNETMHLIFPTSAWHVPVCLRQLTTWDSVGCQTLVASNKYQIYINCVRDLLESLNDALYI